MNTLHSNQLHLVYGEKKDDSFSCENGKLSNGGREVPGNTFEFSGGTLSCEKNRVKAELSTPPERQFNENGKYRGGRFTE